MGVAEETEKQGAVASAMRRSVASCFVSVVLDKGRGLCPGASCWLHRCRLTQAYFFHLSFLFCEKIGGGILAFQFRSIKTKRINVLLFSLGFV